jgi:AmiR/NasT family two-component response regulator
MVDRKDPAVRELPGAEELLRRRVVELEELAEHLQRALDRRDVVGQAKGILIAREGYNGDQAYRALVRASQRTGRKPSEVAADLVARTIARYHRHPSGRP